MTHSKCSEAARPRTDPLRWPRADAAKAQDHFRHPEHSSQRQYATAQGIPRSTLGYWLRRDDPSDLDANLVAFFRSASGEAFLRRLVLAALTTFQQQGACGLRLVSTFLQR